jgi:predicted Zn-dependent protease
LIAVLQNEAQLGAVLAHEITHVVNRHEYQLNHDIRNKALALNIVALVGTAVPLGGVFGQTVSAAVAISQVAVMSTVYGYSRTLEQEADDQGFDRLTQAQYDGSAMVRALQLLDEKIEYEPVEPFWRTHPKLVARTASAQKLASGAHAATPIPVNDPDYLTDMRAAVRYSIEEDLENRRARTALARAQRLVDLEPKDAVDESLLADAYRSLGAKTPRPLDAELTGDGVKQQRAMMPKRTPTEEQFYLARPEGVAAIAANRSAAESNYRKAMQDDPMLADPHRGLGTLYEDEGEGSHAAEEYREYLKLAPQDAVDRLRIERRLQKLEGAGIAAGK